MHASAFCPLHGWVAWQRGWCAEGMHASAFCPLHGKLNQKRTLGLRYSTGQDRLSFFSNNKTDHK